MHRFGSTLFSSKKYSLNDNATIQELQKKKITKKEVWMTPDNEKNNHSDARRI